MTDTAWIEANGVSLRYALEGRGRATCVLVHEMGASLESFDAVTAILRGRMRILRYDLRDSGLSERSRRRLTTELLVGDLDALLSGLRVDEPVIVAGSALGAAVAVAFAQARPERLAGLFMMAPALGLPEDRQAAARARADEVERNGLRPTADQRLLTSYAPQMRSDMTRFEDVRLRRLACDPLAISAYTRLLADLDLQQALARIACPTILLAGRHDQDRPPAVVEAIAAQIPGAMFSIVESGHFMSLQTPEIVADQLMTFAETIGVIACDRERSSSETGSA